MCECGRPIYSKRSGLCKRCSDLKWRDPARKRDLELQRLYGITQADYDRLLWSQAGRCASCNERSDERLCVDHNHLTGEVRGLLCRPCNMAAGLLRADIGSARVLGLYRYVSMVDFIEEKERG